jgi:hypothetical protein
MRSSYRTDCAVLQASDGVAAAAVVRANLEEWRQVKEREPDVAAWGRRLG